jgi:hypothetical protein
MRYTQINPGLGLGPQGGSMSSPRARITLRPELARSSWLDTMMGKSLKKIEDTGSVSSARKSASMGKQEVWERFWLV